jgi:hypothetical protein
MRRLLFAFVVVGALVTIPTAAASPTVRLTIIHVLHGCHVWATSESQPLGAARTLTVKRGTRIEIRINCPMDFDVSQTAGPRLRTGLGRWSTGTSHILVFAKAGVYRLQAVNVQRSADVNLQTLGNDNAPKLVVRVP